MLAFSYANHVSNKQTRLVCDHLPPHVTRPPAPVGGGGGVLRNHAGVPSMLTRMLIWLRTVVQQLIFFFEPVTGSAAMQPRLKMAPASVSVRSLEAEVPQTNFQTLKTHVFTLRRRLKEARVLEPNRIK